MTDGTATGLVDAATVVRLGALETPPMNNAKAPVQLAAVAQPGQGTLRVLFRALPRDENGTMTLPAIDGENFFI